MVPCELRKATTNNVASPVAIEHIHLTVVLDSEHFKGYELLEQDKESQRIEGFNTVESLVAIGVLLTAPVIHSTRNGYNNNTNYLTIVGSFSVAYRNNLEQRDIPTIDV